MNEQHRDSSSKKEARSFRREFELELLEIGLTNISGVKSACRFNSQTIKPTSRRRHVLLLSFHETRSGWEALRLFARLAAVNRPSIKFTPWPYPVPPDSEICPPGENCNGKSNNVRPARLHWCFTTSLTPTEVEDLIEDELTVQVA